MTTTCTEWGIIIMWFQFEKMWKIINKAFLSQPTNCISTKSQHLQTLLPYNDHTSLVLRLYPTTTHSTPQGIGYQLVWQRNQNNIIKTYAGLYFSTFSGFIPLVKSNWSGRIYGSLHHSTPYHTTPQDKV